MIGKVLSQPGVLIVSWQSSREDFAGILAAIKEIPGRVFHPETKTWRIPDTAENRGRLQSMLFTLPDALPEAAKLNAEPLSTLPPYGSIPLLEISPDLRPYQVEGVQFLEWRRGRGLIGDDPGLGKTLQALTYLQIHPELRPALIVVPASIKLQWAREYRKWVSSTEKIQILSGKIPYTISALSKIIIINYDILSAWQDALLEYPFQILILDEFHYVGGSVPGRKSKRAKAFQILGRRIPKFIGLSGTPIRSRPAQFFNVLNILAPDEFPNEWKFLWKFCLPRRNGFGWTFDGLSNGQELTAKISQLMIRREKKEVLKDLPEKIYSIIPMELENRKEYEERFNSINWENENRKTLQDILDQLKSSAFTLKRDSVIRWIRAFLEEREKKIIVYCWHVSVGEFLLQSLGEIAVLYNGKVTGTEKETAKARFLKDPSIQVFIGNIQAAGTGIDGLQDVCSDAAFVEFAWTPSDMTQASDRLHRYGQKNSVNIHYLIAPDTIDEDIAEILERKRGTISKLLKGEAEEDIVSDLIKNMKSKHSSL